MSCGYYNEKNCFLYLLYPKSEVVLRKYFNQLAEKKRMKEKKKRSKKNEQNHFLSSLHYGSTKKSILKKESSGTNERTF